MSYRAIANYVHQCTSQWDQVSVEYLGTDKLWYLMGEIEQIEITYCPYCGVKLPEHSNEEKE